MKKLALFLLILLSIVSVHAQSPTFQPPPWFSKNKVTNSTNFTVLFVSSFSGYPSPSGGSIGFFIQPQENTSSPTTLFLDAPALIEQTTDGFMVIGIEKLSQQPFITSSSFLSNPPQKDYNIVIQNNQFVIE